MSTYQLKAFGLLAILLAATDTAAFACDATTVNVTHQADVTCYGAVGTGSADDSRAKTPQPALLWRAMCHSCCQRADTE